MFARHRSGARAAVVVAAVVAATLATAAPSWASPKPKFTTAVAFDVSPPVTLLATGGVGEEPTENERERNIDAADTGYSPDGALQAAGFAGAASVSAPIVSFEGLRNRDNPFLVNPPDPVGDVGPNHYVEMVNLVFGIYDKQGNRLTGPTRVANLFAGFAVPDCDDDSGDPIVVYDQTEDRWLLTQFTTTGPIYYNCVAISVTGDPTGAYYRYAFTAGEFFPDYPKYGVWSNSYLLTSRDFGPTVEYGISVYALEKNKMIAGNPKARAVKFFLDSDVVPLEQIGDGLLPADLDGNRRPIDHASAPIVGTQDNDYVYGATTDALNVYDLAVQWSANPTASLTGPTQLPTAPFDSKFPCGPVSSRDCLPQPGVTDRTRFLDILSYRQRPTYRLAYRNFGKYESLVTNQSVEALPGRAGVRWYELRRVDGVYSIYQQGTYAPADGVHRWMGSIAMDQNGGIGLGYSVVNGTSVFPGIRYTGRLKGDPAGQMTLGEGVIVNGSGVQLTTNSRWGDYTAMHVDPVDDCTFWYVNEYYQTTSLRNWQTRIASFKLPGCP